jgi:hypothetical protein
MLVANSTEGLIKWVSHMHRKCLIGLLVFQECIDENKTIMYNLIASHGDIEDMIFFAVLIQGTVSDHENYS